MEPFDKEKAYDDFMAVMAGHTSGANTPSGTVKLVKAGQNFLQKIYHQGFNQGYEIGNDKWEKKDDSNGQQ